MSSELVLFGGSGSLTGRKPPQQNPVAGYQETSAPAASSNTAITYPYALFYGTTSGGSIACTVSGALLKNPASGQLLTIANKLGTGLSVSLNTGTFRLSSAVTSTGTHVLGADTIQRYILGSSIIAL